MTRFQAHRVRYTVRPRSMVATGRVPDVLATTDRVMTVVGLVAALAAEVWFPVRLLGIGAVGFWVAQVVVIILILRAVPR